MVQMVSWRNSTPDVGAVAFCTIKIDDFMAFLTSTSTTTSSVRSLTWTRSKVVTSIDIAIEVAGVAQLEETNNEGQ